MRIERAAAVAAILLGLAIVGAAPALSQSVRFTVSGNSTVRSWTCYVNGTAQVERGAGAAVRGFDSGVRSATLTVPVADFECPEDEMREHLLDAMRPAEFPTITYRLDSYQPSGQGAVATGSLTIHGTTHSVTFPIFLTPQGSGVQIEAEIPLNMTDYGVEPPVVFNGLLRVRPQIRIQISGTVGG